MGWSGLLVTRLHNLSSHFLDILAELATIAAPNTNSMLACRALQTFFVHGTFIKELLDAAASPEENWNGEPQSLQHGWWSNTGQDQNEEKESGK